MVSETPYATLADISSFFSTTKHGPLSNRSIRAHRVSSELGQQDTNQDNVTLNVNPAVELVRQPSANKFNLKNM